VVERIATHWHQPWLEQTAWGLERRFFLGSLAWQVERGELAVLRISPQSTLEPKTFFPELKEFSRRNHLHLAFMQSDQTPSGLFSFAIYTRPSDRGTILDFIEQRKGVLTNGCTEPGDSALRIDGTRVAPGR
jgi:hypothetical protein